MPATPSALSSVHHDLVIGPHHKSVPSGLWGRTVAQAVAGCPRLIDFATPLLAIDGSVLDRNLAAMHHWTASRGLDLAPHGKTTMAPALWARLFDHGATALTLATPWQVQVARSVGVGKVMLANTLVSPDGIDWISRELDATPSFEFCSWVDSQDAVRILRDVLAARGALRPLDVIVELGASGGRTGARSVEEALDIARAVAAAPELRLVGAGGYEGALAHDRSDSGLAAVRGYLRALADLHGRLDADHLYQAEQAVITAGGSAYFDLVADELGDLVDVDGFRGIPTRVVLRSGAYPIHDDGFYRSISPLDGAARDAADHLESAMHAWVTIVSTPEPGLALFDAGKRDLPFDEGLPTAQTVRGRSDEDSARILAGARVTALNDQHGFLRFPPEAAGELVVGTVLRLGLSHPCTAFDKWRLIPLIDDHALADPIVVDLIPTYF
ncbi:MAG TPA: amino acid deaminase [Candidatus Nanopelagicales bacterium]|nr:amino acid deaminase [Candidatus Nanopelagicales bacterium]